VGAHGCWLVQDVTLALLRIVRLVARQYRQ
jgi:hypothetical protein